MDNFIDDNTSSNSPAGFVLPKTIKQGSRNQTLFKYACHLLALNVGKDETKRLLTKANEQRCQPPVQDEEVASIFRNALSYGTGKPIGTGLKAGKAGNKVPETATPVEQLMLQMEALFTVKDIVTFATRFKPTDEGKWAPTSKGTSYKIYTLLKNLRSASSIDDVFPDLNEKSGALFCINPEKRLGSVKIRT